MLPEALTALAAAGGTAVVQAAGTEAWEALRDRLARWFGHGHGDGHGHGHGHGDETRVRGELERLDRSAAELAADDGDVERVRARHEGMWQTRIEDVLEGTVDEERRARIVAELRQILEQAESSAAGRGGGLMSGNTFHGPTAVQVGDHNRQDVRFGARP